MTRWLDVDQHSGIPIYLQIVEQIRHALEVGGLRPGDQLPTVRQLATELTIAPNTIVKAYNELQRMGLIESRPGVGTVVSGQAVSAIRQHQVDALFERLRVLVRDAAAMGVSDNELSTRFAEELSRSYGVAESMEEGQ